MTTTSRRSAGGGRLGRLSLAAAFVLAWGAHPAHAKDVRIVGSFGLCYLPVVVALDKKLIEKHAAAAGIPDVKASFQQFGSGPAITDAILSGNAEVAMAGVSVMLTVSDKSVGRNQVKGMMG